VLVATSAAAVTTTITTPRLVLPAAPNAAQAATPQVVLPVLEPHARLVQLVTAAMGAPPRQYVLLVRLLKLAPPHAVNVVLTTSTLQLVLPSVLHVPVEVTHLVVPVTSAKLVLIVSLVTVATAARLLRTLMVVSV